MGRHREDERITSNLTIALEPIVDADALAPLWLELEDRSQCSFFQSWGWIGTWLRILPPDVRPRLLSARNGDRIVALGVLIHNRRWRHGLLRSCGLYLNETGDPALDHLTIEYNGILVDPNAERTGLKQCIGWLVKECDDWDELYLSGLGPADYRDLESVGSALGLKPFVQDRKPAAYVDLDRIRQSGADYLAALSSNTRYQIRRSLRLYDKPQLLVAASVDEALAYFAEMKQLHQAYWVRRGRPGSFANPVFEAFHTSLIRNRFDRGEIQLARIAAGERPIGYLYNFVYRQQVYAYQSGFNYETDAKLKPGLVSHYLTINYSLTQGAAKYDFLAGEGQHKQSLGTANTELTWLVLQRDLVKYRLEDALRSLKRRFARQ